MVARPWSRESQTGSRVGCEGISSGYLSLGNRRTKCTDHMAETIIDKCIKGYLDPIARDMFLTILLIIYICECTVFCLSTTSYLL